MKFRGEELLCLLDTGCEITVLSARLVARKKLQETDQRIRAANNTEIPVLGWATLRVNTGTDYLNIRGLVSEHVSEPLLGHDWLSDHKGVWAIHNNEVSLNGKLCPLESRPSGSTWVRRVRLAEPVNVPARMVRDVKADIVCQNDSLRHEESTQWATVRREVEECSGLWIEEAVIPTQDFTTRVRVVNATEEPIFVDQGTELTALEPVTIKDAVQYQETVRVEDPAMRSKLTK